MITEDDIKMDFTNLVTTISFHFMTSEFIQDEIKASGIKINELPEEIIGVDTLKKYLSMRESHSHDYAVHELDREVSLIERYSEPMNKIPKNPIVLAEMFQELSDEYELKNLGDKLKKNPRGGKKLIENFKLKEMGGIEFQTLEDLSLLVKNQIRKGKENKSITRIEGFERLSEMIGGFNPQRLGMFLGGTGFGKTNFAVNLALAASQTMRVAYVNMEMGYTDMLKRFVVILTGATYSDYAKGNLDGEHVENSLRKNGRNLMVTSGKALSYNQIFSWCKLLNKQQQLGLVVVDYDQKVELNLRHQAEEWKALQKTLEGFEELSKDLNLYCLVLAQVNRDGNISGSHRSMFPASTVMQFEDNQLHGTIIQAIKNRHGRKNQALKVLYNDDNSQIKELETIMIGKKNDVVIKRKLKPEIIKSEKEEKWFQK